MVEVAVDVKFEVVTSSVTVVTCPTNRQFQHRNLGSIVRTGHMTRGNGAEPSQKQQAAHKHHLC